jgi:hypothetical protein
MIKGHDGKPVKWGDYSKQYIPQSEFTKKAQQLAKERQDWENERAAATQRLVEEARKIAEAKRGGREPQGDPLAELRSANYIDGKTAAGILEAIQQRGIKPIVDAIGERDKVIQQLSNVVTQQGKILQQMQQASGQTALKQRIAKTRQTMGRPEEAMEYLEDLYASHEGEDWDSNFDTVAQSKFENLRKVVRALDKKAAEDARKKVIASAGGQATPGKKLERKFRSPSEVADSFAEAIGIPD